MQWKLTASWARWREGWVRLWWGRVEGGQGWATGRVLAPRGLAEGREGVWCGVGSGEGGLVA